MAPKQVGVQAQMDLLLGFLRVIWGRAPDGEFGQQNPPDAESFREM